MEGYAFYCSRCRVDHSGECPPAPDPAANLLPGMVRRPAPSTNPWEQYLPGFLPADLSFPAWAVGDVVAAAGTVVQMVLAVLTPPWNSYSEHYEVEVLASTDHAVRAVGSRFKLGRKSFIGEHSKKVGSIVVVP